MVDNPITIRRISAKEMCEIFNEGQYWERVQKGEFSAVLLEDRHPSLTLANEPFCTHSQMVSYLDSQNDEVARVHQYLRPDKTIGASGRPDPKRLRVGDTLYRLHKSPRH
jgi:hypothetical protein